MIVRNMTTLECTKLLDRARLGRLACSRDNQPYVVPLHFVHAENRLYAFSVPGKKIEVMRSNPKVCVLAEEHGAGREWKSVVVDGYFEEFPNRIGSKQARDHAWSLLSKHAAWWEPGALKPVDPGSGAPGSPVFFAIRIDEVSGREARDV
jgi:nitroimidazol reductase NimA-like FMN-containing flavoprotein (pyridoxamine 5'-phosphate oxidase superfamily)